MAHAKPHGIPPKRKVERYCQTMPCPICGSCESFTIDSRPTSNAIRRRRVCRNGHRYTTYERVHLEQVISYDI